MILTFLCRIFLLRHNTCLKYNRKLLQKTLFSVSLLPGTGDCRFSCITLPLKWGFVGIVCLFLMRGEKGKLYSLKVRNCIKWVLWSVDANFPPLWQAECSPAISLHFSCSCCCWRGSGAAGGWEQPPKTGWGHLAVGRCWAGGGWPGHHPSLTWGGAASLLPLCTKCQVIRIHCWSHLSVAWLK